MSTYAASARQDNADAATVLSKWLAEVGVELSDNQLERLPDRDLHLRSGGVIDLDDEDDMRLGICRSGMLIAEQPCGHDKTDRAIVAIHLPGEIFLIGGLFGKLTRQSVRAITPTTVALYNLHDLEGPLPSPSILRLYVAQTREVVARARQMLIHIHPKRATPALAYLLCDISSRLHRTRDDDQLSFRLPLTKKQISAHLGYTDVHLSRAVQDLRERGLISWNSNKLEILNWEGLSALAAFREKHQAAFGSGIEPFSEDMNVNK